jgi:hypothetical protein
VLRSRVEKAPRAAKPGVREDDVESAEALECRLHHRLLLRPFGDVAADSERAFVAAELVGECPQALDPARAEYDAKPRFRGAAGAGLANAAGRSGDEENRVCHWVSASISRPGATASLPPVSAYRENLRGWRADRGGRVPRAG